MSKLVKMKLGESTILVEAADDDLRLVSAGDEVIDAVDQLYEKLVQNEVVENCRVLIGAFEKLKEQSIAPYKGTAEFGLQFTGEGNIYLVKASAQASIKITLEWQLSSDATPSQQ
jgi:hypothetical protein